MGKMGKMIVLSNIVIIFQLEAQLLDVTPPVLLDREFSLKIADKHLSPQWKKVLKKFFLCKGC